MIKNLQIDHEVMITCRHLANTIELLELSGFSYHVIGKHYGSSAFKKVAGFIVRIIQLHRFLRNKNIEVSVSHSSFYSPVVSRLLGIRCIYLNDNEHAKGNNISFLCADKIMVPEFLDIAKVKKQWAKNEKIIRYPGVKEGIYLWNYEPVNFNNGYNGKKNIYIRTEPWTAQYYKSKKNFTDELLIGIKDNYNLILLPRGKEQVDYYRQKNFNGVTVQEKSIGLDEIMNSCDLFIGAGGTMTREAAVLGIPTISIYQDELLDVDKFLIQKGSMVHKKDIHAEFVGCFLKETEKKYPDKELLKKGRAAYHLIKNTILE
jgi:predicted glycosyltransferase